MVLHANHATPGYRPGDIVPGQWQLVLGAYLIEAEGCPVEITIRQTFKTPCLLVGDCHVHTEHSDGWYPVEALLDRARQDKLDFIFVTDHNCMTSNALLRSDPTLTVLPGVEMTYYDGHYNLFGLPRPVATNTANGRDEVLAIMREGKKNGALASLNHPTCNNCGWKYGFDADVPADLIEIWNGPFTPQNAAAVQLWHEHLCRGRRWPAIGGSDCHHAELFRIVATPATFLYAASNAPQDILDAMAGGHAFVGMQPNAPRIHMAMGDARMGEVCAQSGQALQLTLGGLSDGDEVRLIDATGVVWRQAPGRCHRYEAAYGGPASKFLRVEIWRELPGIGKTLASIGNPIYMA